MTTANFRVEVNDVGNGVDVILRPGAMTVTAGKRRAARTVKPPKRTVKPKPKTVKPPKRTVKPKPKPKTVKPKK